MRSFLKVNLNGEWHNLTSHKSEIDWYSRKADAKKAADAELTKQMMRWRAADPKYMAAEMRITHPM